MPAARKSAKSRHKLSFAVDRSEIDISSDWVQAVMEPPPPAPRVPATPPGSVVESINPSFSSDSENSATVEPAATVAHTTPVANNAAVEFNSSVANNAAVANNATAEENTTGALFGVFKDATVENNATVEHNYTATVEQIATVARPVKDATVEDIATVVDNAPVAFSTTVAFRATVGVPAPKRTVRLRPIQRITDGLTPGQYSVYSLMFERGETREASTVRLFRGGYVDLVRLTGLSKRGIQNVIAELQAKSVISIHQAPGYHRSQTTVYDVPHEQAVLDRWFAKGLRYASGKSKNLVTIATVE